MTDLKKMYHEISKDPFPVEMSIRLGETELKYRKRTWTFDGEVRGLRYGENPDQPAALYELVQGDPEVGGIKFRGSDGKLVSALTEDNFVQSGKHPGKINLTDVDNGLNILQYLSAKPAAIILKHNNPCGAAWSEEGLAKALEKAFYSDRVAAFGGTVIVNRVLDKAAAELINSFYFEVVAAPGYEEGATDILKKRKNLRIFQIPGIEGLPSLASTPFLDVKSLLDGGMIVQASFRNRILAPDDFIPAKAEKDGQVFIARKPTPREADDLLFAWAVESGVSSNSVIFVKDGATVSVGTGEQDRVGCVELTIHKAYTKYADRLSFTRHNLSLYELKRKAKTDAEAAEHLRIINEETAQAKGGLPGSVLVSDGFFPFRDGVDLAIEEGVTAIAQPGGSIRDFEIIQAVNQAVPQVAMVFTGQRSFKH